VAQQSIRVAGTRELPVDGEICDLGFVTLQLQQSMPEGTQTHFRSIVTDPYLRAVGSNGTILAIGDGATVEQVPDECTSWRTA
jgi:hypothetical protein